MDAEDACQGRTSLRFTLMLELILGASLPSKWSGNGKAMYAKKIREQKDYAITMIFNVSGSGYRYVQRDEWK